MRGSAGGKGKYSSNYLFLNIYMNSYPRALLSRFLLCMVVMASALGFAAAPAAAQNVAMVTDVSGKVAGTVEVTILSEIPADARVQLEAGARLVTIYLKSGDEYSFTGPSQVQFQAGEPKVLSGAKLQKRASPLGKGGNITIKPVGVAQAAYVMRSGRTTARIKLLTLSGTRTLESPPEFRGRRSSPA